MKKWFLQFLHYKKLSVFTILLILGACGKNELTTDQSNSYNSSFQSSNNTQTNIQNSCGGQQMINPSDEARCHFEAYKSSSLIPSYGISSRFIIVDSHYRVEPKELDLKIFSIDYNSHTNHSNIETRYSFNSSGSNQNELSLTCNRADKNSPNEFAFNTFVGCNLTRDGLASYWGITDIKAISFQPTYYDSWGQPVSYNKNFINIQTSNNKVFQFDLTKSHMANPVRIIDSNGNYSVRGYYQYNQ